MNKMYYVFNLENPIILKILVFLILNQQNRFQNMPKFAQNGNNSK